MRLRIIAVVRYKAQGRRGDLSYQQKQEVCEMKTVKFVAFLTAGVVACSSLAYAQSDTEKEVTQAVVERWEYRNANLKDLVDGTSEHGALEFWSSGGLLQEFAPDVKPGEYDVHNVYPKHIKVITLVEGQAAVALYYLEGSMKSKGGPLVNNYLTRATAVYVKEDGEWKRRSGHWSPITGGSGISQTALEQ
jgi:hypothetical protein